MKKKSYSAYIAPVVISLLLIIYYIFIALLFLFISMPVLIKVLIFIVTVSLSGVVIFVLRERIKELKSGELDDLSKY